MKAEDSREIYRSDEKIKKYNMNRNFNNNVGVLCGEKSGIVVIDIDVKGGGIDYWNELEKRNTQVETLKVRTGSGGIHYYFNYKPHMSEWTSRNKIITENGNKIGIDFRTQKGYVVTPPSIHPESLKEYYFENEDKSKSYREQIKDMPEWLNRMLVEFFEEVERQKGVKGKKDKKEEERDEITNEFMINEFYNTVKSNKKLTKEQLEELEQVKFTDEELKSYVMNNEVVS